MGLVEVYFWHRLFLETTRHIIVSLAVCDVPRLTHVSIKIRIHTLYEKVRCRYIVILKLGSARIQVDAVGGSQ